MDDSRLGPQARQFIEDPGNDVLISVVSLWEIVVKVRIGKLAAEIGEIAGAIERDGFTMIDIGLKHLLTLSELPDHHRDPFDQLLIAQAIVEEASFVSDDRNARRYPVRLLLCSGAR
jgi:PIN domain nuclease of toxin-antitoxin system